MDKVVAFDLRAVVAPRMVVTAAGGWGGRAGVMVSNLGHWACSKLKCGMPQRCNKLFFVMSSFVGHHRLVGLLELVHEIFDILFQIGCRTGLFSVGGSIG